MNKIIVFGTGSDLNDIDFSKIDKSFITAGVNRIHEKIIPQYYYAYDLLEVMPLVPDTIKVIYTHPDQLYRYMSALKNYKQNFCTYYDKTYTPEYWKNGIAYDCGHASINYLIRMLNDYIYTGQDNVFYIVGVPLLEGKGHFYDDDTTTTTQQVLDRFYNDFLRLVDKKYNMISLMAESRLNNIIPSQDINIIYGVTNE